jgi:GT2 family glycosyltransferase
LYKVFPAISLFNRYYAQQLAENLSGPVDILVGAFMVLPREVYLELGGFDENCFMYSDDIDLSYMIQKLGMENFYFHETSVIHYKGESTVRDEKYLERFREAMQFFYKKHFKKSWFFDKFLQIGSLLYAIFKQKQPQKLVRKIDKYIVFSKKNIQLNLNKPIEYLTDFEQFKNTKNMNFELIFDINSFSFAEIIYFMEKHKSKNITFKNYISQSNYLIGSNNSTDRGEVLIF